MRLLRRVAWGMALFIGVPVLLAALGTIVPHFGTGDTGASASARILILANPIHTDIAIPIEPESLATLGFLAGTGPPMEYEDARWLLVGWGARSFYMETPSFADIKPGPTLRALTFDNSVMHVDVLPEIALPYPGVTAVDISDDGYSRLLAAISASFSRVDGQVMPIAGYALGANDRFYAGEGGFNALLGCNTWTARMLREAGLTTGLWNPLPASLTLSLGLFNRLPGPSG